MTLRSIILLSFMIPCVMNAQVSKTSALYNEIMEKDSLMFELAFNQCKLDVLYKITDDSLEFYHDQSGLTFGQDEFINGLRKNICSLDYSPIRKLDETNNQVFPLHSDGKLYAAIQNGVHQFYAEEPGKEPYLTSTAKFSHLWVKDKDDWILRTVLSYDHRSAKAAGQEIDLEVGQDTTMYNLLEKHKVPALAMAKIEDYKLVKLAVYGNLYEGKKASLDAIFNVASLAKPVVTMLSLKLVENGDWELDAPLSTYWKDSDVQDHPWSDKLTTRHVLSHQTGFPNWRAQTNDGKLKFNFEPGTGFAYSGEGYEYLQKALEKKFDKSLQQLADSLIFTPLGMRHSTYTWSEGVDEKNFARWHNEEGKQEYATYKNTEASAADDLLTSIGDYGRFAEYVINGGGLSQELFSAMTRQQNGTENNTKIGLGWEILPNLEGEEYAFLHTGGDIGVRTLIILLPETGEGLVIFTNADNGNRLFFDLIDENLSLGKLINSSAQ